jgi:hypothetical protein
MAHKWPQIATRPDVRFGSLAAICSAQAGVRYVPIADSCTAANTLFDQAFSSPNGTVRTSLFDDLIDMRASSAARHGEVEDL